MAGGSYFKGWTNTLPNINNQGAGKSAQEVYIGHVLEVDYENDLGKIRVRLAGASSQPDDDLIVTEAYPADLNIIKYPLPGEIVMVIQAIRNDFKSNKPATAYYYLTVLSSDQSVLYNSDPYIGQTVPEIVSDRIFTPQYETRFEKKFIDKNKFIKQNGDLKERGPLKPTEGDFIIQGRFGSSIRMGSTGNDNPWSGKKSGAPGSPILVIAANKNETTSQIVENVNADASSIYFCSTQQLKVNMSTSRKLATHRHRYDIKDAILASDDITKFIATNFVAGAVGGFYPGGSNGAPGQNGNLPESSLKLVGIGNHKLEIAAADAFILMANAARAAGITPALTDSYRTYETQNRIFDWDEYVRTGGSRTDTSPKDGATRRKIGTTSTAAAFPGTSNHGLGRAIDADGAAFKAFIRNNGVTYGWSWYEGRRVNENWHFTYDPTKKDIWPITVA